MEQQDRGCTRCDLRSDLPRLRTLRAWYAIWLARLDEAIAAAEQQEREREQGEQARAPAPHWLLSSASASAPHPSR